MGADEALLGSGLCRAFTVFPRGERPERPLFRFYNETADALAAATYLENLPGIDRNRFFIAGHSNGGTLTLLAAMSRKFRAAAPISAGVNSWRYFNRYSDEICFDETDEREFIMRSSVCFGPSLKCPALLLRGTEERPFDADHQLFVDRALTSGFKIDKNCCPAPTMAWCRMRWRRASAFSTHLFETRYDAAG